MLRPSLVITEMVAANRKYVDNQLVGSDLDANRVRLSTGGLTGLAETANKPICAQGRRDALSTRGSRPVSLPDIFPRQGSNLRTALHEVTGTVTSQAGSSWVGLCLTTSLRGKKTYFQILLQLLLHFVFSPPTVFLTTKVLLLVTHEPLSMGTTRPPPPPSSGIPRETAKVEP
eukprot:70435-Prorocentrum_minimum.AAC.2